MVEPRHGQFPKNGRTGNFLRAAEFRYPKWIPATYGFMYIREGKGGSRTGEGLFARVECERGRGGH